MTAVDLDGKIRLEPITRENWRAAIALRVRPDQETFVPSVAISLAKVAIRPDGPDDEFRSYGVMVNDVMVGFGQLAGQFATAETLWIGGLLIDVRYQGRGFGRATVNAFVDLARLEPTCRAVGLTVEPHNEHAQRIYRTAGFSPTGRVWEGELVYRLTLAPATSG